MNTSLFQSIAKTPNTDTGRSGRHVYLPGSCKEKACQTPSSNKIVKFREIKRRGLREAIRPPETLRPAPRLRISVVQYPDYVKPRGLPAGGKQTSQRDRPDNNMPSKRGNAIAPWTKAKTCQPPGPPPLARRQNHWPRQRHKRLSPDPRPSQAGFMVGPQPWPQTAIFARRESATVATESRNGCSKAQAASRTTPEEVVQYLRIKEARRFHHP